MFDAEALRERAEFSHNRPFEEQDAKREQWVSIHTLHHRPTVGGPIDPECPICRRYIEAEDAAMADPMGDWNE